MLDKSPLAQPIWLGFFVFELWFSFLKVYLTSQQPEFTEFQKDDNKNLWEQMQINFRREQTKNQLIQ
ncbi:hypothetical protein GARC_1009 [Paraglaciecola arctica BSs20135]|uniref:Uncharacterized protein n=1 Tax=Paraglaciecola arctica BSs20135 TaxID=493475 RepID=K6Z3I0_9ALTE|nr:hypothetical protein GARC_1009 [Paraglaciecola arctica BSs20135]